MPVAHTFLCKTIMALKLTRKIMLSFDFLISFYIYRSTMGLSKRMATVAGELKKLYVCI